MVFALDSATEECWWVIKPAHGTSEADTTRSNVNSGDKVRLEHQVTRKNLHSHPQANFKSPITRQQETTAYGSFGTGNDDDNWIIELLEGSKLEQGAKVILRHVSTGLVLHSHGDQAHKEYTDGEQEVTCLQRGDDNDVWQISEINISPERAVQPVISLSLDGRFGPFNFYSIDEFAKWFATEEATWSWLHHEAAIFAISGGAVGIGLYQFLVDMSSTLLRLDKIGVHDYWRFAIILFTATVAIWVARLVVQLIFSNLHQWTDSRERQTMIQTYIALKKEGYLPEGKDATHILEVLFRPGDSGLLKGDRGPATPTEMVVKHFDRQGDS